jgi:hypothetical protein
MAACTACNEISEPSAANAPSSGTLGTGRRTCFMASSDAGTVSRWSGLKTLHKLAQPQLLERLGGVDEDVAVFFQATEHVHLVQQRRVLDDDRVGLHDGLAQADFAVVHAAKRHHRCTGALGTKAGKRLRMAPPLESSDGQHFSAADHALPTSSVNTYLEHAMPFVKKRVQHCAEAVARPCRRAPTQR